MLQRPDAICACRCIRKQAKNGINPFSPVDRLSELKVPNSGPVDRYWFRSLYFREPNGILFEIASDGPGFGVDEDEESLGEKVVLAPFLEPDRERIVGNLVPIE